MELITSFSIASVNQALLFPRSSLKVLIPVCTEILTCTVGCSVLRMCCKLSLKQKEELYGGILSPQKLESQKVLTLYKD